jgi:hypothetical protein
MATYISVLPSGAKLQKNEDVLSNSGRFDLVLQGDGNLVLYDTTLGLIGDPKAAIWASDTYTRRADYCLMQGDGNLVMFGIPNERHVIWDLGTAGHANAYLVVQDDGNLVLVEPSCPVWDRHKGNGVINNM